MSDDHLVPARDLTVHRAAVDVRLRHLLVDPAGVLLHGPHLLRVGLNTERAEHDEGPVTDIGQASHKGIPSM